MTPEDGQPNTGSEANTPMEAPIAGLPEHSLDPTSDLWAGIRRRIHRRETAVQFAAYSWSLPKMIFTELIAVARHLFFTMGRKEP